MLQSYWNESKEVDVAGPHMMQRRSLKNTRQKRETRSKANPQCKCFTNCQTTSG